MNRDLYITISHKKVQEIKASTNGLSVVMTLDELILGEFEKSNMAIVIDSYLASSIIYKIIQNNNITYFDYFKSDSNGLEIIYSLLVRCKRNDVNFKTLFSGKKLEAIDLINNKYQKYKKSQDLVDISDIEEIISKSNIYEKIKNNFKNIYIDNFIVEDINFIKSKLQEKILQELPEQITINTFSNQTQKPKIIKPSIEVFDSSDEVRTAIKIIRKLMEDGNKSDNILLVADNIRDYSEFYRVFCDEYEIKGYSSIGLSLDRYFNIKDEDVKTIFNKYNSKIKSMEKLYQKLNLELTNDIKQKIKSTFKISDKKIGIELCELNDLVGTNSQYEHIIFIGGDINRFPKSGNDNFLWSYEIDLQDFYKNNYFTTAKTCLNELYRLTTNLYIVTANYNGKRELVPSILLGNNYDEIINIDEINSINQLSLNNKTVISDNNIKEYYHSIIDNNLSKFDGIGVNGFEDITLSASQINRYISCPLSYLYLNRLDIKSPSMLEDGFDIMQEGSLMHLCYELFGKRIRDRKITHIDLERLFELMYQISEDAFITFNKKNNIAENVHHRAFLSELQSGLKDNNKQGILAKFVNYYIEKSSEFEYFKESKFEYKFALDKNLNPSSNRDNVFIKGVIDRVDILNSVVNIIDYKSKNMSSKFDREKIKQIKELKDVQLALYILYVKQQFKDKNYYASLLSFKGKEPYYHFANLSTEDIKNFEIYDKEYEDKLKELIFTVRDNIIAGNFGFNDSDKKICGYCNIKNICNKTVLNKSNI